MVSMIIFVIVVITILYFISKGMGSKNSENPNDNYRKEFNKLVNEFGSLSKEEQRNRLIKHVNECNKKRSFGMMSFNAIEDVNYLIIANLKMGKDIDVAKQVLLEIYDIRCKKNGFRNKIESLETDIEYYQEEGETEIANIYQELKSKYEEERSSILNIAYNEIEHNIENNRFIETNIPIIAEEGCFEIFDNIEVYEYKTRYGATNYEKVGEGRLYITNKKLYFITDINAFPLVWLNNIMDVNWYFLEDENKFQLKITRDGNAIFLESYDEVDIFKMYCYIKTINGK